MAQAFAKIPVASPLPTAPPHPRDLARKLDQRQLTTDTCGWIDGDFASPQVCSPGCLCAYNTESLQSAAFCCNAASFPAFCEYQTTCLDSTAVAESCSGACLENTSVLKCTSGGYDFCQTQVYSVLTLDELVTAWNCDLYTSQTLFVYDQLLGAVTSGPDASTVIATNQQVSYVTVSPSSSPGESTSVVPGPTTTSTTPGGPVPVTPNVTSSKSGISAGAIAGIVVGAVLAIVIVLGMILLYRYKKGKRRDQQPPPPPQLSHDTTPHLTGMAAIQQASPPLSHRPSNFTMPSNTPLVPHATNEIEPGDSASNIGGPYSMVSQSPPPDVSSEVNSYPTSHSALGNLPQFSTQHGVQPVASPGTEFGSMPPVHAPDVNPGYTFVPKGPQQ